MENHTSIWTIQITGEMFWKNKVANTIRNNSFLVILAEYHAVAVQTTDLLVIRLTKLNKGTRVRITID